jgi:hypothetical protein
MEINKIFGAMVLIVFTLPIANANPNQYLLAQTQEDTTSIKGYPNKPDVKVHEEEIAQLDKEVNKLKSRKGLCVLCMVGGGAAAIIGAIITFQIAEDKAGSEDGIVIQPNILGLVLGIPLLFGGYYCYTNTSNKILDLEFKKMNLGYDAKTQNIRISLNLHF